MAELIDLPFGLWTRLGQTKHIFNGIRPVAPMCSHVRAHWRNLANTTKPSICGGDADLCQITLTTSVSVRVYSLCLAASVKKIIGLLSLLLRVSR